LEKIRAKGGRAAGSWLNTAIVSTSLVKNEIPNAAMGRLATSRIAARNSRKRKTANLMQTSALLTTTAGVRQQYL